MSLSNFGQNFVRQIHMSGKIQKLLLAQQFGQNQNLINHGSTKISCLHSLSLLLSYKCDTTFWTKKKKKTS